MYGLARDKVIEILEALIVGPLFEKVSQEIDEILVEADRALNKRSEEVGIIH